MSQKDLKRHGIPAHIGINGRNRKCHTITFYDFYFSQVTFLIFEPNIIKYLLRFFAVIFVYKITRRKNLESKGSSPWDFLKIEVIVGQGRSRRVNK